MSGFWQPTKSKLSFSSLCWPNVSLADTYNLKKPKTSQWRDLFNTFIIWSMVILGGSTEVAYLLLTQQHWVQFLAFPRIFLLMLLTFIDWTAQNSGQRLDNVNKTHLVLASGKLVLQKSMLILLFKYRPFPASFWIYFSFFLEHW